MKITLLLIGKTDKGYLNEGIELYVKRIKRYIEFEIKTLKGVKYEKNRAVDELKDAEAKQLFAAIAPNDHVVLLDEKGDAFDSLGFASFMTKKTDRGIKHLVFIVGGAYGFSDSVCKRADEKISLSKMTFSHQIIRLIFAEQLYRAFTIIKGEPYHNE